MKRHLLNCILLCVALMGYAQHYSLPLKEGDLLFYTAETGFIKAAKPILLAQLLITHQCL